MGTRYKRQNVMRPTTGLNDDLAIQISDIIVEIVPSGNPKKLPILFLRQTHSDRGLLIPLPEVEHLLMALVQAMQRSIRLHTVAEISAGSDDHQP